MREISYDAPPWRRSEISWPAVTTTRAVLAALVAWADRSGVAKAVRHLLARELNVTERTITRALDALELLGYLERVRVLGWSALAFRILVCDAEALAEPSEAQRLAARVAELEHELATRAGDEPLAREAGEAREAIEGAEVVPIRQRSDADDARDHVPSYVYAGVVAGKILRVDLPEHVHCAPECGCGGRYRIRTCDFIRVKDAVKGVPQLSDDAQIVREAYMAERGKPRDGKPGARPGTFKEPPAKHWDPWIESAQAVAYKSEKAFAEATRALVAHVWARECVGNFRAAGCPVNWFVNEPRDDIEREVIAQLKRAQRVAAHAARKREPCKGRSEGCTGCVECRALECERDEREERQRQDALEAKKAEQRRKLKEAAA